MIPRYFPPITSYDELKTEIGTELKDCYSCTVVQEKAGAYTCTVEISLDNSVEVGGYIKAKTCNILQPQTFIITSISKTLQRITLICEHIKFILNDIPIVAEDTGESSVAAALAMLTQRAKGYYQIPFTFTDAPSKTCNFGWNDFDYHTLTEYLSGDNDYSISTIADGFFVFDNFDVKFRSNLDRSSGATVEFGKNLTDINYQIDNSSVYNCVFPIFYKTNSQSDYEICFYRKPTPRLYKNGDYTYNSGEHIFPNADSLFKLKNYDAAKPKPYILNIADSECDKYGYHFAAAAAVSGTAIVNFMSEWIADNEAKLTVPTVTVTVNFVDTGKSAEFAKYKNLSTLVVGESVDLHIEPLKINTAAVVAGATYDSLSERYTSLTLSTAKQRMSNTIIKQQQKYKQLLKTVNSLPTLISTITSAKIN